jgi:hypothetical protein
MYFESQILVPRRAVSEQLIESALQEVPNRDLLLTSQTGVVINCDREHEAPDGSLLDRGLRASVGWLKSLSASVFRSDLRFLADIGCWSKWTPYAEHLFEGMPGTSVVPVRGFTDSPFRDGTAELAHLRTSQGVSKSKLPADIPTDPTSFEKVREAARILRPAGLLLIEFTGGVPDPRETLMLLKEAGFLTIGHVHRVIWHGGVTDDLYVCRRAAGSLEHPPETRFCELKPPERPNHM